MTCPRDWPTPHLRQAWPPARSLVVHATQHPEDGRDGWCPWASKDHPLGGAFRLSLHGLRWGEVCGLRWEGVELAAGDVTVRRSRVLVAGVGVVEQDDVKTGESTRTVWAGPGTTAVTKKIGRGLRPGFYADRFVGAARDAARS